MAKLAKMAENPSKKKATSKKNQFWGTGRRKKSIAKVTLTGGTGNITVNGKDINEYFGEETLRVIVKQPLEATETLSKLARTGFPFKMLSQSLNISSLESSPSWNI